MFLGKQRQKAELQINKFHIIISLVGHNNTSIINTNIIKIKDFLEIHDKIIHHQNSKNGYFIILCIWSFAQNIYIFVFVINIWIIIRIHSI